MADYNLGTASGRIEVDGRAAAVGFKVAETAAGAMFEVIGSRVQEVQNLGKRMAAVGAAGVTGFGFAVKAATSFEQQMSGVLAVTNATQNEFDALREKALQLGADTSFSASEAALAIEELAKAGIPVADILNGAAEGAVALAAAGGVGLAEAATIASNAMNQFGLGADEVQHVADVLAGVANVSAADVSSIGTSLSQAGAVANLAGLSFRDTAIAIGEMADAGINGSDAGTSLKTMLNNLIPTTDKQINKFKELGLLTLDNNKAFKLLKDNGMKPTSKEAGYLQRNMDRLGASLTGAEIGSAKQRKETQRLMMETGALSNAFFDAKGNVKDLEGLQGTLSEGLKGMTKQQKLATLETLFGADAMRATAILSLEGAEGYREFSDAVSKTKASEVAAQRMNNLSGFVEEFKGSLETAAITIGSVFLPVISQIVKGLTWLVNAFNGLPGPVKTAISVLGLILSSGALVLGMLMALAPVILGMVGNFLLMRSLGFVFTFFKTLVTAARAGTLSLATTSAAATTAGNSFRTLGVRSLLAGKMVTKASMMIARAAAFMMGPWGIAIAIIAGLALLGVKLYRDWEPFRVLVDKIAAVIKDKLQAAWIAMQPALKATLEVLKEFGNFVASTLLPVLAEVGRELLGKMMAGWTKIQAAVSTQLIPAFKAFAKVFMNDVVPAAQGLWEKIQPLLAALGRLAVLIGTKVVPVVLAIGKAFIQHVLPILIKVAGFIAGVLIDSLVMAVEGIIQFVSGIIQFFTGLIKFFKGVFTGDWGQAWEGIKDMFFGILNAIVGGVKTYLAVGILKIVGVAWKGLLALFRGGWTAILGVFRASGAGIMSMMRGLLSLIVRLIKGYINMWISLFRMGFNLIRSVIGAVLRGIVAIIKSIFKNILSLISNGVKGAQKTFRAGFNLLPKIVQAALRAIGSAISKLWSMMKGAVSSAMRSLRSAVKTGMDAAVRLVKNLPGDAKRALGDLGGILKDAGKQLIQGFISGIEAMAKPVKNAAKSVLGGLSKLVPGSPVKEGPLKVFNRGYTGSKLMEMFTQGVETEALNTAKVMQRAAASLSAGFNNGLNLAQPIMEASVTANLAPVTASIAPAPVRSVAPEAKNGNSRLVSGTLRIDSSGRAYIQGIAEDVVDEQRSHDAQIERMSR